MKPLHDGEPFFLFVLCLFFGLLVAVTGLLLAKLSKRSKHEAEAGSSGGLILEAAWTAIPLLLVAILLLWGLQQSFDTDQRLSLPEADEMVPGYQPLIAFRMYPASHGNVDEQNA